MAKLETFYLMEEINVSVLVGDNGVNLKSDAKKQFGFQL